MSVPFRSDNEFLAKTVEEIKQATTAILIIVGKK